jgi:hypothetical protein
VGNANGKGRGVRGKHRTFLRISSSLLESDEELLLAMRSSNRRRCRVVTAAAADASDVAAGGCRGCGRGNASRDRPTPGWWERAHWRWVATGALEGAFSKLFAPGVAQQRATQMLVLVRRFMIEYCEILLR